MLRCRLVPGSPVWNIVVSPDVEESTETVRVEMVELFDVNPAPRISIV